MTRSSRSASGAASPSDAVANAMFERFRLRQRRSAAIAYLQQRLAELANDLRKETTTTTQPAVYLPKVDRILALFLELGHLYHLTGRYIEEAQVKVQTAKFLLILPAQPPVERRELAIKLLREAIAAQVNTRVTLPLADSHVMLSEYLMQQALTRQDPAQLLEIFREAEEHLLAAAAIYLQPASPDPDRKAAPDKHTLQMHLADLYNKLGNLEKSRAAAEPAQDRAHLEKALVHYAQAEEYCSAASSPDLFAITRNNVGSVQVMLALIDNAVEHMRLAAEQFRTALSALDRHRQPQLHALVHTNLGEVLLALSGAQIGPTYEQLQQSLLHFGEALPAFPPDRFPQQYAKILYGQGRALKLMGQREEARNLLAEALIYRAHLPNNGRQVEELLHDLS